MSAERLPFRVEPGHDLAGVHARLDDFERDLTLHGFLLLSDEHQTEATLPNLFLELVRPDLGAGALGETLTDRRTDIGRRFQFEQTVGVVVGLEEDFDPPLQLKVAAAGLFQKASALASRLLPHLVKQGFLVHRRAPGQAGPLLT